MKFRISAAYEGTDAFFSKDTTAKDIRKFNFTRAEDLKTFAFIALWPRLLFLIR